MANKKISDLTAEGTVDNTHLLETQDPADALTKKATVEAVTRVERLARVAQDDVIEAGVGLDADGSWTPPVGTSYIGASTDVKDALDLLDAAIGGGGELHVERISVSTANLNNAGVAPYEIIAAAGGGFWIEVIACSIFVDYDSAKCECGSQKLILQYDTGASEFMEWSNAFIESTADAGAKGTWTSNVTMLANKKVELTFDGAANPTSGDTQLKVWITYIIRDDGTT